MTVSPRMKCKFEVFILLLNKHSFHQKNGKNQGYKWEFSALAVDKEIDRDWLSIWV